MSCLLTSTIFGCQDFALGGVSRIFLANYSEITNVYFNSGDTEFSTVSSISPTSMTWYEFQVNISNTGANDTMNNSIFGRSYTHKLSTLIIGLDVDKRDTLNQIISSNNIVAIFQDANLKWWILGEDKALKVDEYNSKTGINKDEQSSYFLTLSNTTKYPMRAIDDDYVDAYITPVAGVNCNCTSLISDLLVDLASCEIEPLESCPLI